MTCTLDELYAAFVGIIAGLREDTTACLCNTYFSALITPLQDKIEDYNFCMPALHGLTTKTIQLGLLCIVGSTAFKSFKSLNDEETHLRSLLSRNGNHRGSLNLHGPTIDQQSHQQNNSYESVNYQSPSLAEDTLWRYDNNLSGDNPNNLPTRVGTDGVSYPFNPDDPGYLSAFPANLRGCFKCGSRDHITWKDCPLKNTNDKNLIDMFYKELKIHKPKFWATEKLQMVRIPISH